MPIKITKETYKDSQRQTRAKLKEQKLLWSGKTLDLKIRQTKRSLKDNRLTAVYKKNAWESLVEKK